MISVKNIYKSYEGLEVLKGVSLEIKEGEIVSIVGTSGAGKSTLLQIMGTLAKADSGLLKINNKIIDSLNTNHLSEFRNKEIGFIFQAHHLLPEFTALENVCIPTWIKGTTKKEAKNEAVKLLGSLGLADRIHHKPMELSGGEQQRVAVARALINKPSVVFADEPSGNLDTVAAKSLHELFFKLRDEFNQTFVIVTHNRELAKMSDRMLEMKDGNIV
ncbi:MAG: ABC transporter ATP-binding protein [Flavobacteriales bacterium]|jgi:lipoprotein-releasing system ATP-binding protein|tara:strand:- start:6757 stop:7407 length:651 start_codon:yes stop_codon:yes gene_type:complete